MDTPAPFSGEMSRARIYKLLADCYHQPANRAPLLRGELMSHLEVVCPRAADAASRMSGEVCDLAVDHARLFVGPFALNAPPYGSLYLEGEHRCMGESTLDAAQFYAEFGLGAAAGYHDALDHIAVELEFMHYLCARESAALSHAAPEDARYLRSKERDFLERHLAAWITEFTRAVEEHAQTDYYRNLAQVSRLFVLDDLDRLVEQTAAAA